jgi:phage terminase large subunit GpA-like protein
MTAFQQMTPPPMPPVLLVLLAGLTAAWAPPPKLTISQWADAKRVLSPEASAARGRWRTERTPYLREIMDAVSDPEVERVIVMSSSQVGKTEVVLNVIGYHMDVAPCPMLLVYPTEGTAEDFSKERLAPMLRDTPCLAEIVRDKRRDSNNTILKKIFPGGHLTLVGANAPAGLASKPIKIVLCDEVDRFEDSAGDEGDPVSLAEKRTLTFWDRKIVLVSTPAVKGRSRIETEFLASDQRRYFVPCPHCAEMIRFMWGCVEWPKGKPEEAYYICDQCGSVIMDADLPEMLAAGEWRPTWQENPETPAPPRPSVRGFHLNEMYAPWANSSFGYIAGNHVKAVREGAKSLQVWVNTSLGETWEEEGEKVDWQVLHGRREEWNSTVPQGAAVLIAGVDVQKDRLEVEIVGWGIDHESWSVDYQVFFGNPEQGEVWEQLDRALLGTYPHESGNVLSVAAAGVDTGYKTQQVHDFCRARWSRHVYALKGMPGAGRPLITRPAKPKPGKCPLFTVGTDTAKDSLYSRLGLPAAGPGYCHFPMERTEEYFRQLTVERQVTKYNKGHAVRVWMKPDGARNEALDCRVYATAALAILNPDLAGIAASLAETKPPVQPQRRKRELRVRGRLGGRS